MFRNAIFVAFIVVASIVASSATAHPGHGANEGIGHYLLEPEHMVLLAPLALIALLLVKARRPADWRRRDFRG